MKKLLLSMALILVLLVGAVASCSSNSTSNPMAEGDGIILSSIDMDSGSMGVPGMAPYPTDVMDWEEDEQYLDRSNSDMKTAEAFSVAGTTGSGEVPPDMERMIVRTGNISLVVEDVTGAIDQIKQYADGYDGWVVSSSVWKNGDKLAGSITFRVAADKFDQALTSLRNIAVEVIYENTSSQDVTQEYVDLNATLNNLEATEQQYLAILDKAETVEAILEVQKALSEVRGDIEVTKARMQYLEQTTSTSIIYVQLEQSTMYFQYNADKWRGVKEGEKIQFTVSDISGGFPPYSYEWDFGDGETSTDANPIHSYSDDGYFAITLTVTDDKGNTETSTRENYIYIEPGWNPGSIAGKAWDGLGSFGKWLVDVLIWVGVFSPVWLIIGGIIIWRVRKKRASKDR